MCHEARLPEAVIGEEVKFLVRFGRGSGRIVAYTIGREARDSLDIFAGTL